MLNDEFGLNLTFATLASYIKYPNHGVPTKDQIAKHKIGVFDSELEYFNRIVDECGLLINNEVVRHPLCYLMEAADSICYLTMDIEDGYSKGLITLQDYYNILKDIPSISEKITEIYEDKKVYYKNDITKIVNFRIHIIWKLVELAINNFINHLDEIEAGTFNNELIFLDENQLAEKLKAICSTKILTSRDVNSLEVTGFSVMKGLLDYYIEFLFHEDKKYRSRAVAVLSKSLLEIAFEENDMTGEDRKFVKLNDYYKLRIIVDFISGMTDQFALNHFQKISGQKII